MNVRKFYETYQDMIFYLFFGVCTTGVNVVTYWVMAHPLGVKTMPSTIIAWVAAVIFAYITNRTWVFPSHASGIREILTEMSSFFVCRFATGIVDWGCMFIFVNLINLNDVVVKVAANIIVIVLNYIASKWIIFKAKDKTGKTKGE